MMVLVGGGTDSLGLRVQSKTCAGLESTNLGSWRLKYDLSYIFETVAVAQITYAAAYNLMLTLLQFLDALSSFGHLSIEPSEAAV